MQPLSKPRTQFFILVIFVGALLVVGNLIHIDDSKWTKLLGNIPFPVAAALYVSAYVGITFFAWFTKDLFRIVGAVVFGPFWSTLFVWIAELANAGIFFNISRRLGREYVEERFKLKKRQIDRVAKSGETWHIFLLRTLPIIPFRILDLAYGLTSVRFGKYIIISAVAMPVRIFWVQFIAAALGSSVLNIPKAMAYFQEHILVFQLSFLYLIFSTVAVLFLRKRLK